MKKWIERVGVLLYKTPRNKITSSTRFKDLEEWNLWFASSLLASIKEEYDVQLNGSDLQRAETFGDLFGIIETYTSSSLPCLPFCK